MSINRVIVTGNLTRDAEYRETATGTPVVSFGIAVNDRRKNAQTGEWEEFPNFFNVVRFNGSQKLADALTKGTALAVEGKLSWSSWEQDGQKRQKVEIFATQVEFIGGSRGNNSGNGSGSVPPAPAAQPYAPSAPAQDSLYDEDIPF